MACCRVAMPRVRALRGLQHGAVLPRLGRPSLESSSPSSSSSVAHRAAAASVRGYASSAPQDHVENVMPDRNEPARPAAEAQTKAQRREALAATLKKTLGPGPVYPVIWAPRTPEGPLIVASAVVPGDIYDAAASLVHIKPGRPREYIARPPAAVDDSADVDFAGWEHYPPWEFPARPGAPPKKEWHRSRGAGPRVDKQTDDLGNTVEPDFRPARRRHPPHRWLGLGRPPAIEQYEDFENVLPNPAPPARLGDMAWPTQNPDGPIPEDPFIVESLEIHPLERARQDADNELGHWERRIWALYRAMSRWIADFIMVPERAVVRERLLTQMGVPAESAPPALADGVDGEGQEADATTGRADEDALVAALVEFMRLIAATPKDLADFDLLVGEKAPSTVLGGEKPEREEEPVRPGPVYLE